MTGDSKFNLLACAIVKSYNKLMSRNMGARLKGSFMETAGANLHIAFILGHVCTFRPN